MRAVVLEGLFVGGVVNVREVGWWGGYSRTTGYIFPLLSTASSFQDSCDSDQMYSHNNSFHDLCYSDQYIPITLSPYRHGDLVIY